MSSLRAWACVFFPADTLVPRAFKCFLTAQMPKLHLYSALLCANHFHTYYPLLTY